MEVSKAKRTISLALSFLLIVCMIPLMPQLPKAFAQPQEAAAVEPADGQIIPYYEVWLRWNDVSDEDHYIMSIRDLDTNSLIYDKQYVSRNSTYFIVPLYKLTKGHTYRWSLCSVAADGSKNYTPPRTFKIESGLPDGTDSHLWKTGYSSANYVNYFIHAPLHGHDSLLQQAVEKWNGISSNVYLYRDYSDATKKLGIYESDYIPSDGTAGITYLGGSSSNLDNYTQNTVSYAEVIIYHENISSNYWLEKTVKHETGHALSLAHTDDSDYYQTPNAPHGNRIDYTIYDTSGGTTLDEHVKLLMNKGFKGVNEITTTDRDHLRIKWGA